MVHDLRSVPPVFRRTSTITCSSWPIKKVKTLLDTDGDALLHGLEAQPTVVTPNQQEAERLLNRALITRTHLVEAVERFTGWALSP